MPRLRTVDGRLAQFERPNWDPLIDLVGLELVNYFMWMNELELEGGTPVHAYKHRWTRRYLHLSEDGRAFAYLRGRYAEFQLATAIDEVFGDWEPDGAARDALEDLRRRHAT